MKILFYGINFAPEMTGVGKYMGEMASWLARAGHEVRIITGPPYYPEWRRRIGYNVMTYRTEIWEGVRVLRCPLWVPKRPSGLKRLIHLSSFAISSFPALLAQWRWSPDVTVVVEPPLMCAPATILFTSLFGVRSWLHIQDYEVDAAFELGLIKGEKRRRVVQATERRIMRRFDRVSTISGRMVELAKSKGVEPHNIIYFPNWVDLDHIQVVNGKSSFRAELGLPDDAVVALYSGNMGNKQGLEILASVARLLADKEKLQFIFCGNGTGRQALEASCNGLVNVHFLDLQPIERLSDLLGLADIHLLPQRADAADLVMPSKLTGMLASGRAVVATAKSDTELANVVVDKARCGLVVPPEDSAAMADAVLHLFNNSSLRSEYGKQGRAYAESELDCDAILGRFEKQLIALKKNKENSDFSE
ncbi:glycosyltransferase WbuB [Pusillimonas noertemannii]|uniref:glycosyltransferase WbuB n=1 Tax=Pusillimonas noertemannii TaxID=305977 RepID=UPI0002E17FBD|nr:glycosyltransferase WbuB [Pusillimonas noertemannii]